MIHLIFDLKKSKLFRPNGNWQGETLAIDCWWFIIEKKKNSALFCWLTSYHWYSVAVSSGYHLSKLNYTAFVTVLKTDKTDWLSL